MRYHNSIFILVIISILLLTGSALAGSEPRPSESISNALFFGDIESPLPVDLTLPPVWKKGMQREFSVLDITAGQIHACSAR